MQKMALNQFIEQRNGEILQDGWPNRKRSITGQGCTKHAFLYLLPQGQNYQKLMQNEESMMKAGGRENYAIKVIETAGNTLENVLVKSDPFGGNKCDDKNCIPNKNPKN